jgi:hypothetical protein
VGSRTADSIVTKPINELPKEALALAPYRANTQGREPVRELIPAALNTNTITRQQLLRPFLSFSLRWGITTARYGDSRRQATGKLCIRTV